MSLRNIMIQQDSVKVFNLQGAAMHMPGASASGGEDSANMAEIEIPLVGLNVQALAVPETWS